MYLRGKNLSWLDKPTTKEMSTIEIMNKEISTTKEISTIQILNKHLLNCCRQAQRKSDK